MEVAATQLQFVESTSSDSLSCWSAYAPVATVPYGQLPEVPFAGALPVVAFGAVGAVWYRRKTTGGGAPRSPHRA